MVPGLHRLFLDFCSRNQSAQPFYGFPLEGNPWPSAAGAAPPLAHRKELVEILRAQNPWPSAGPALEALAQGARVVVTGQQVGLFGGPLFTPLKAATALARARQATAAGRPHVAIFWLASEDHDFAEIDHVTLPARRELRKLVYSTAPETAVPVGRVALGSEVTALLEQASEALGASEALDALTSAYQPGHTFAQGFAEFYAKAFASQNLLVLDAAGRRAHRLGAPVLRAAIERADELHAALLERNRALEAAGYEPQVAVAPNSSLLFLIDNDAGARVALKRHESTTAEPDGLAGKPAFRATRPQIWSAFSNPNPSASLPLPWYCGRCSRTFFFRHR